MYISNSPIFNKNLAAIDFHYNKSQLPNRLILFPLPRIAQNIHFVQLLSTQKKQSRHIGFIPTLKEPLLSPFLFNRHNPDALGRFNAPKIIVNPTDKVCVE